MTDLDPTALVGCDCNATIGNETLLASAVAVVANTTATGSSAVATLVGTDGGGSLASSLSPLLGLQDNCICQPPETALSTKIVYALWVWCIFLTFPGTYAMQPAVTTQTFGHK